MKDTFMQVRTTHEMKEHYQHQARNEGFPSLSAYILWLLNREWKRILRKRKK